MGEIKAVYAGLCSACGGDLCAEEAMRGMCARENTPLLKAEEDKVVGEFFSFFKRAVGEPRSLQRLWAHRILRGESFAAVAPTGIGKTSFGTTIALFLATRGKRSYIVLPTGLLVNQVVESLGRYGETTGIKIASNEEGDGIKVLFYHAGLSRREKEQCFRFLEDRSFHILVTTTHFLSQHFARLEGLCFDFIFVDDVDAILKASRNVDRILRLLGFRLRRGDWEGEAKGSLMVSTATARRGHKVKLFRKLLNFDVGASTYTVRNIEDIAVPSQDDQTLKQILRLMGPGGLIYAKGEEEALRVHQSLAGEFKVGLVTAGRKRDYRLFAKGEIDYLVGTAYYYGALVRGLDLPERIRFTVFLGAPAFRIKVEDIEGIGPALARSLAFIFKDREEVRKFVPILPFLDRPEHERELLELKNVLKKIVEEGGAGERDIVIRKGEIIFPDVRTYIQGSGRTSRLFAGGITRGASFLLEGDGELRHAFIQRAGYFDISFKEMGQVDFESLVLEIEQSRERFKKRQALPDLIKPTLFIVESPTKARQISRFFAQPSVKVFADGHGTELIAYEVPTAERVLLVAATIGHLTDLVTHRGFHGVELDGGFVPVYASIKRCRGCGYQFTEERGSCPRCGGENIDDSKWRIKALRRLAKDAGLVLIGTDPDAEGEKIAWDLRNLLAGSGEIKRAEFHEVTRRAVMEALSHPRDIDENLVRAQLVRRVEDRWIGFVLSQKLWEVFGDTNLSAGRAQTPVLGWVIGRAREFRQRRKVAVIDELDLTLEGLEGGYLELEIELLEETGAKRTPPPPYTTDTLLRDAGGILRFTAREAMHIAQDLFESGLITYPRTDSTRVSDTGIRVAREYLGEGCHPREWAAEGAHECIRPTRPIPRDTLQRLLHEGVIPAEEITGKHLALYDLVFRRFMASQCPDFAIRTERYQINVAGKTFEEERTVSAEGRAVELYRWAVRVKKPLPQGRINVLAETKLIPIAPLFTQADLIHLMKEKGIGRPSTYATIVDRLFLRDYVIERGGRIMPTRRGEEVYNYLSTSYGEFVSEERTRLLESKMDAIEKGEADYTEELKDLYQEIKRIS